MAEKRRYYSVYDLLNGKSADGISEKIDSQIRSTPSLSGIAGATNARLKPGMKAWRITRVLSWLPDPVETPVRVNHELMKTARPEFNRYGLMYKPYAEDVVVYGLDNSPAPMTVEMEIALEAVIEAYDKSKITENGRVPIHTTTRRFILPAQLDMKAVSLILGMLEPERPFSTAPERIFLDRYLLPAEWDAHADDLLARRILMEFMPECLYYELPLDGYELARRMGLQIRWKLLSHDFGILGEIFNRDCTTEVIEIHSREENKNYPVSSGTILLDDRLRSGNHYPMEVIYTTLVHECVHWYKDRMYSALQNMFSPQKQLSICRNSPAAHRSGLFEQETDNDLDLDIPSDLMEAQALALPPHILINADSGRRKVAQIIDGFGGQLTSDNYYAVLDEIRSFFAVTRYAADKRLREFGYKIPFLNRGSRRFTYQHRENQGVVYEVSFERICELMDNEQYPEFHHLIQSGRFIHVDYRLCLNNDKYIEYDAAGIPHLTVFAKANPSKCCISFRALAAKDPDLGGGAMAASRPKPDPIPPIPEATPGIEAINRKYQDTMAAVAHVAGMKLGEEMEYHRKNPTETTFPVWSVMSFVAESRLSSLCKDPVDPQPEFNTFLRSMLALHLGPEFTFPLIEKADLHFPSDQKQKIAIRTALQVYYECSVLETHRILFPLGFHLIGKSALKKRQLDESGQVKEE